MPRSAFNRYLENTREGSPRRWGTSAGLPWALSLFGLLLLHSTLFAQYESEHLSSINQGPAGQFLELVDLVAEPEKQLGLLDTFVTQFPDYDALNTIHAQRQELCVELKHWDRALDIGAKLLAQDESDIETVRRNLKAAEGKGDAALVSKWTERLKQLELPDGSVSASSNVRLPFVDEDPAGDLEAVDLSALPKLQKNRVEAFLFNRALTEKDSKRKLQLMSLFERQFPTSSHLGKVRYMFFLTHLERQDSTRALAAAEAVLERDKSREDVLFYAAQHYFVTKRSPEKVLALSTALLNVAATKPKPEQISQEAWDKQKALLIHQAHWMTGSVYMQQERWADADKSLHAALSTAVPGSELTEVLTLNLGWTSYKLRKIPEALKYYQQCVAMRGPNQAAAAQSIVSIKSEYALQ